MHQVVHSHTADDLFVWFSVASIRWKNEERIYSQLAGRDSRQCHFGGRKAFVWLYLIKSCMFSCVTRSLVAYVGGRTWTEVRLKKKARVLSSQCSCVTLDVLYCRVWGFVRWSLHAWYCGDANVRNKEEERSLPY